MRTCDQTSSEAWPVICFLGSVVRGKTLHGSGSEGLATFSRCVGLRVLTRKKSIAPMPAKFHLPITTPILDPAESRDQTARDRHEIEQPDPRGRPQLAQPVRHPRLPALLPLGPARVGDPLG